MENIKSSFHTIKEMNDLLAKYSLSDKKTELFGEMDEYVPGIGQVDTLMKDAFSKDNKIFNKPTVYKNLDTWLVAEVIEMQAPDYSQFDKDKEKLVQELKQKKESMTVQHWMQNLEKSAKIAKNQGLFRKKGEEE